MADHPFACTLGADQLRRRRADLLPGLLARATSRETIDSGMELRFEAGSDTLADLVRVLDAERQCCRFLQFELTIAPDLGPMTLRVSGPAGTAEFLSALLDG